MGSLTVPKVFQSFRHTFVDALRCGHRVYAGPRKLVCSRFVPRPPKWPPTLKTHPWPSKGHYAHFRFCTRLVGLWSRLRTEIASRSHQGGPGGRHKARGTRQRMRVAPRAQAASLRPTSSRYSRDGIGPVCRALSARAYRMRRQRSERRSRDRVRCRAPKCRGAWRIEGRPLSLGTLHCRNDRTSIGDRTSPRLAGLHGCMQ